MRRFARRVGGEDATAVVVAKERNLAVVASRIRRRKTSTFAESRVVAGGQRLAGRITQPAREDEHLHDQPVVG